MVKVIGMRVVGSGWKRCLDAARRTVGKGRIDKEPSDRFKAKMLLAEHSPIRLVEYDFSIEGIRQWVSVHLVRHHVGCEKFVHSQRTDRNELLYGVDRDSLPQGMENDMDMTCNAQALINISRKRLCRGCASAETREVWEGVIRELSKVDRVLASKCVPECIYRGFCPEFDRCCGYCNTGGYRKRLEAYRSIESGVMFGSMPIEDKEGGVNGKKD